MVFLFNLIEVALMLQLGNNGWLISLLAYKFLGPVILNYHLSKSVVFGKDI